MTAPNVELAVSTGRQNRCPSTGHGTALPKVGVVPPDVYRPFFLGGIITAVTAGAAWGVWLLWQIGVNGSFTGVSIHDINAHGHAQVSGWVGLFVMGFGYQMLPRFWRAPLPAAPMAGVVFALMAVGVIGTTTAIWLHEHAWAAWGALGGGTLELTAIAVFSGQLAMTFRRSAARLEPYVAFILAGLACFVAQAGLGLWHTWNLMTAGTREEMLYYVQTYQAVLRNLQIHGLALLMILGISLRLLPMGFGLRAISAGRAWTALVLVITAVVGESMCMMAFGWTGNRAFAAATMGPWVLLAIGALIIPWRWRIWLPIPEGGRSGKFVRAAYLWLAISMALLLLLPVYAFTSGIAFSHAYFGAVRHAITVGFVSLMIMGVAARVVPVLNGVDSRSLSGLWGPFLLVNLGCLLRVTLQVLTDWHPAVFPLVGVSGVLELAGLAWWGVHLLILMHGEGGTAPRRVAPYFPGWRFAQVGDDAPLAAAAGDRRPPARCGTQSRRQTCARRVQCSTVGRVHA